MLKVLSKHLMYCWGEGKVKSGNSPCYTSINFQNMDVRERERLFIVVFFSYCPFSDFELP